MPDALKESEISQESAWRGEQKGAAGRKAEEWGREKSPLHILAQSWVESLLGHVRAGRSLV